MKHTITKHSNIDSEVGCKIPTDIYVRRGGTHRNGMFSILAYNLVFCAYLYLSDCHLLELFLRVHEYLYSEYFFNARNMSSGLIIISLNKF